MDSLRVVKKYEPDIQLHFHVFIYNIIILHAFYMKYNIFELLIKGKFI